MKATDSKPKEPAAAAKNRRDMSAERRRLQMADIARLAGVSVATVSRALSGSTLISKETRERIGELAKSLNYSINVNAQNFRLKQNRTVAVVIPYDRESRQHISDPFFLAMVGALADALTDRGFDMLLSRVDSENLDAAAQLYSTGVTMGVILIGQWRHHDQLNDLASRKLPIVVWGTEMPQQLYCSVGGDNVAGGELATRHLLELGHRRIAFVGDPELPEVTHRYRGYLDAHAAFGVRVDPGLLVSVPFEANEARNGVRRLHKAGVAFDAVFACSDVMASAVMQALHQLRMPVPEQISVVGFDDIEWASHSNPPLTTVRQPIQEAGAQLVESLLRIIAGSPVRPITLPVELVVRESTHVRTTPSI